MSSKTKHGGAYLPFFVYGTLIPGQPNAPLWSQEIRSTIRATLSGCLLYDMGYYPMLVEAESGQVHGVLVILNESHYDEILQRIDLLEGFDPKRPEESEYRRVVRSVTRGDGASVQAWVYVGEAIHVAEAKRIKGGDWLEHVALTGIELETWWRTINTVSGLHGPSE